MAAHLPQAHTEALVSLAPWGSARESSCGLLRGGATGIGEARALLGGELRERVPNSWQEWGKPEWGRGGPRWSRSWKPSLGFPGVGGPASSGCHPSHLSTNQGQAFKAEAGFSLGVTSHGAPANKYLLGACYGAGKNSSSEHSRKKPWDVHCMRPAEPDTKDGGSTWAAGLTEPSRDPGERVP